MMNCAECTAAKMGILLNYSTVIWATGDVAYIAKLGSLAHIWIRRAGFTRRGGARRLSGHEYRYSSCRRPPHIQADVA